MSELTKVGGLAVLATLSDDESAATKVGALGIVQTFSNDDLAIIKVGVVVVLQPTPLTPVFPNRPPPNGAI